MTSMQCHICRMTGANNTIIDSVNQYIVENAGAVQMHEIVCQVCDVLGEHEEFAMTPDEVTLHITEHVRHQKVIMNTVLNDLLRLSRVTKSASVNECGETGIATVDHKMLNNYLKIVDQIITVYRMDGMKESH